MQILSAFATSQTLVQWHLGLTIVLLVAVVSTVILANHRQKKLRQENRRLLRDIDEMQSRMGQNFRPDDLRSRDFIDEHDHYEEPRFDHNRAPEIFAVDGEPVIDFGAIEAADAPRLSPDSAYLPRDVEYVDPDFLVPLSAAVTNISTQDSDLDGPIGDSINDESDPLTRALQISKVTNR